jgi:hypothetical protein
MDMRQCAWSGLVLCGVLMTPQLSHAQNQLTAEPRDGQHDFDWDIGTWKMHARRLLHPLTGSTQWAEYAGTDVVRKVWDGKANLGEVEADGPTGHLEILTLRLYNPDSHQWSMNITSSAAGALGPPTVGEFKDGQADFVDQEVWHGKLILLRFHISNITSSTARFEQAFSADAGKTWETNWIVDETLVKNP